MSSNTPNDPTTPRAPGGAVPPPTTPPTPIPRIARNRPPSSPPDSDIPFGWVLEETRNPDDDGVGPFARYDEFTCRSLAQLIRTGLHPGPRYDAGDKNKSLASTKELSLTELTLPENLQLTRVVFAPNMLSPLMKRVKTELSSLELRFEERVHSDFVPAVSAWHTFLGLTRRVNSEKDVEDWVGRVILAPALHVVLALREKAIPDLHHEGQATFPLQHLMREGGPYVASAPTKGSIPDAVVVDDDEEIKGTVEVKTENVLQQELAYHTFHHGGGILAPILVAHLVDGQPTLGRAIKFIWPTHPSSNSEEDKSDPQTRILVQIWTQMVTSECDLGMLSSYVRSVFYHRDGQTLYMTGDWKNDEEIFLATVAWMAMVLEVPGYEKSKMNLPEVDDTWWKDVLPKYPIDVPGVVVRTLPMPPETEDRRPQR